MDEDGERLRPGSPSLRCAAVQDRTHQGGRLRRLHRLLRAAEIRECTRVICSTAPRDDENDLVLGDDDVESLHHVRVADAAARRASSRNIADELFVEREVGMETLDGGDRPREACSPTSSLTYSSLSPPRHAVVDRIAVDDEGRPRNHGSLLVYDVAPQGGKLPGSRETLLGSSAYPSGCRQTARRTISARRGTTVAARAKPYTSSSASLRAAEPAPRMTQAYRTRGWPT